jgi:hypothetical protein
MPRGRRPNPELRTLEAIASRFWCKVKKTESCWLWIGAQTRGGYGCFGIWNGHKTDLRRAHRFSYELTYGEIPTGLVVRHTCDIRACVNPAHLCLGTQEQNIRDMHSRGRAPTGSKHHNAKIDEDIANTIRTLYAGGQPQASIARQLSVSPYVVHSVVRGLRWRETNVAKRS